MSKFSHQVLSYYKQLPKKPATEHMVCLPVWIWQILAPAAVQHELNFFQQIVLEFLHIGKTDRKTLAEWIGIDIELIDLIIDTELEPNGWIKIEKDKITLTDLGQRILENENEQHRDLQPYYLLQDAITGQLWQRLIPQKLKFADLLEHDNDIILKTDRDSGHTIHPFIVEPFTKISQPQKPTHNQILQTIQQHNWANRSQVKRAADHDGYYINKAQLNDYIFSKQSPEPFFILSHLQKDNIGTHLCQLQDPCHVSQVDEWIANLHIEIAKKHKPFSNKVKGFSQRTSKPEETIEQFEERINQEISFEVMIHFPQAHKITNLENHLFRLLARQKQVQETRNKYDVDDLINQCQKSLEACFKKMLKTWQHIHADTTPKQMKREAIKMALVLRSGQYFNEHLLEQFCTINSTHVFSANGYSAGRFPTIGISLKPLIVSNLLCIPDHQQHPLIQRKNAEHDLESLLQICESRNNIAHDSSNEIDISTALILSNFTLDWISFFTAIEA